MDVLHQMGWFAKLSLLVGIGPLAVGIAYVLRPTERTLAFARPVSLAAIFAGLSGLVAGLVMVLQGAAVTPGPLDGARVFPGLAEALVPVFVNFGFLAVAWLLVAAGMLRRGA